jgi:hypothetical protein
MSNIAGKSYAMTVITPIPKIWAWVNLLKFWYSKNIRKKKSFGLQTLSLIHYARWIIIRPSQFPRLSSNQPKEDLHYAYMLFFSNFNGSWSQYVDSFHMAIPKGLDRIWKHNFKYPKSVPLQPFHRYILHNQIWTDHYYNAYPLASSNDVKAAIALRAALLEFIKQSENMSPEEFQKAYKAFLFYNQQHIAKMHSAPVINLADQAKVERVRLIESYEKTLRDEHGKPNF